MEEQVQMNEKLRALLEKAKREKKIASKDLIDALEAIDADEKQTELIYEALDEAGVEIDVSDVVELLSKPEEMLPERGGPRADRGGEDHRHGGSVRKYEPERPGAHVPQGNRQDPPAHAGGGATSSPCAWPRAMRRPAKK